jgi:hypothetical protein
MNPIIRATLTPERQALVKLIDEIADAAAWRGHTDLHDEIFSDTHARVTCSVCSMSADADTNPPANGINIGGELVALNCSAEITLYGTPATGTVSAAPAAQECVIIDDLSGVQQTITQEANQRWRDRKAARASDSINVVVSKTKVRTQVANIKRSARRLQTDVEVVFGTRQPKETRDAYLLHSLIMIRETRAHLDEAERLLTMRAKQEGLR